MEPIANVQEILARLPARDSDYLALYYVHGKTQSEIAQIFGVTQGTVSVRLKFIIERVRFLESLPKIEARDLEENLSRAFDMKMVRLLVTLVRFDGHQRRTANNLHVTYQAVCLALRNAIRRLERLEPIAPALGPTLALLRRLADPARPRYFEHGTFRRRKARRR